MPIIESFRDRLIIEQRAYNGTQLPPTRVVAIVDDYRRDWGRTPNFKTLRKSGAWIPPQPFVFGKMTGGVGTISASFPPVTGTGSFLAAEATVADPAIVVTAPFLNMSTVISDAEVSSKALKRVAGARFQAPVAFLEAGKTSSMIANRVIGLGSALRHLRRGNLPAAARALNVPTPSLTRQGRFQKGFGLDARKAAGDTWLELQYGWLPFLGDIKSAAELLADCVSRERNRVGSVTVSSRRTITIDGLSGTIPIAGPVTDNRVVQIEVSTRTQYEKRLKFHYRVDDEILRTVSQLSLVNPFEVAWELVPFSFVIDWMLPVGDYLSNMSALNGIEPLSYSIGDRVTQIRTSQNARYNVSSDPEGKGKASCDNTGVRRTWVSRRVYSGAPPNSFDMSVKFPFTDVLSARFGNAVALLSQQLSRISR